VVGSMSRFLMFLLLVLKAGFAITNGFCKQGRP
jgi:hypothetical protein